MMIKHSSCSLKFGWPLAYDAKRSLQREAGLADCSFIEKPADECYSVRDAARRREFWQRPARVGGPVRARLGHFHESGAQRQRRMASEICDRQFFIGQRRTR